MADVITEDVRFQSDNVEMAGFLARSGDAPAPAVVVIQEWWGLTDHIKDIAKRFAQTGFAALAPDLYSRQGHQVTADPGEAAGLMNALSVQQALLDLNAATKYLASRPFVDAQRIGAVGFCMGGTFALTIATHNSDIKAAVPFYGKVPPIESLNRLLCPVLYHYGAKDGWVTKQESDRLQQGFEKFGKQGQVCVYPEAGHAFFNDTRPDVYRESDASVAWDRTLKFLAEHLR